MSEFKDKVVVVTGGANGIGKCITEEFRKEGVRYMFVLFQFNLLTIYQSKLVFAP